MGSFKAKPILVRVISSAGEDLGMVRMRPTGANWRQTAKAPSVSIGPRDNRRLVRCEFVDEQWQIRLMPGESKPSGVRQTHDYLAEGIPA